MNVKTRYLLIITIPILILVFYVYFNGIIFLESPAEFGIKSIPEKQNLVHLNGVWEYYPNEILDPGESFDMQPESYANIRKFWNKPFQPREVNSATYRITINSGYKGKEVGLIIPCFSSAYKIFVDGGANNSKIEVFNKAGQLIINSTINSNAEIDISDLESGMYFLRIGQQTLKFIKN